MIAAHAGIEAAGTLRRVRDGRERVPHRLFGRAMTGFDDDFAKLPASRVQNRRICIEAEPHVVEPRISAAFDATFSQSKDARTPLKVA